MYPSVHSSIYLSTCRSIYLAMILSFAETQTDIFPFLFSLIATAACASVLSNGRVLAARCAGYVTLKFYPPKPYNQYSESLYSQPLNIQQLNPKP